MTKVNALAFQLGRKTLYHLAALSKPLVYTLVSSESLIIANHMSCDLVYPISSLVCSLNLFRSSLSSALSTPTPHSSPALLGPWIDPWLLSSLSLISVVAWSLAVTSSSLVPDVAWSLALFYLSLAPTATWSLALFSPSLAHVAGLQLSHLHFCSLVLQFGY